MSFNPRDYPVNWPALRAAVLARADHRCEGTARYPHCRAVNHWPHPDTGARVVLTIAHKTGTSKMSQDIDELLALCQRCHLDLDRAHHLAKAAATRARKRGQLAFDMEVPHERTI